MGTSDPPSTIIIAGVLVVGLEEFVYVYLGSKQSSNGYCRPDVLRTVRRTSLLSDEFSTESMDYCSTLSINTKVHLYQSDLRRRLGFATKQMAVM